MEMNRFLAFLSWVLPRGVIQSVIAASTTSPELKEQPLDTATSRRDPPQPHLSAANVPTTSSSSSSNALSPFTLPLSRFATPNTALVECT